ncbi:MAG: hypothetical protein IPJ08_19815 [Burkholderiales bacterium]|nr:hypothetical protein [Burkholderiales bacterium]
MKAKASSFSSSKPGTLPANVADVALIAANTCAAIGEASVSWWYEAVRTGRAPKPAIKQPRFTRWRRADAVRFWADLATQAAVDTAPGERMTATAKKASAAAKAKRALSSEVEGQ